MEPSFPDMVMLSVPADYESDPAQETPLVLALHFTRRNAPTDPYAFQFGKQEYMFHRAEGGIQTAILDWDDALLADLDRVSTPGCDAAVVQRLGARLRAFVEPTDWRCYEDRIAAAVAAGQPVYLTVLADAAELYALPWELLTLADTGQHVGELPGFLVRYAWPRTRLRPQTQTPRAGGGRIVLAWADAGGLVPSDQHRAALSQLEGDGSLRFVPGRDELARVSYTQLADALVAAVPRSGGVAPSQNPTSAPNPNPEPVVAMHLLCHGVAHRDTFAMGLHDDNDGCDPVNASRLRALLAPHAGSLRLVVLCACHSGDPGTPGNYLGSVAQALHRTGIESVVAARFPLSVRAANCFARAFYEQLAPGTASVEQAFVAAQATVRRQTSDVRDWMSMQLYAAGPVAVARPAGAEYGRTGHAGPMAARDSAQMTAHSPVASSWQQATGAAPSTRGAVPAALMPRSGTASARAARAVSATVRSFMPRVWAPMTNMAVTMPTKMIAAMRVAITNRWGRILALAVGLVGCMVVLMAVAPALGAADHHARLALIGVPAATIANLDYPVADLRQGGQDMLINLGTYAGSGLLTGAGWERWAMLLAIAIITAISLLVQRSRWRLCVVAVVLLWPLCAGGLLCYAHAVGVHHVVLDPAGVQSCRMGVSLPETIRFEVCSWLANATEFNAGRRQALGGLWVWSVLVLGVCMGVSGYAVLRLPSVRCRARAAWRAGSGVVAMLYAVLFILLLGQAPKAHAVSYWGLAYPRVTTVDAACAADLAAAVQHAEGCRAFDISETASQELILFNAACLSSDSAALASPGQTQTPWQSRSLQPQSHPSGARCMQQNLCRQSILNRG